MLRIQVLHDSELPIMVDQRHDFQGILIDSLVELTDKAGKDSDNRGMEHNVRYEKCLKRRKGIAYP